MDLYLAVFEDVYASFMDNYNLKHGAGPHWLVIATESLVGLGDAAREQLLQEVGERLHITIYKLSDVRGDATKFELDASGNPVRSIDGYMLTLDVRSYTEDVAKLTSMVWYGNLGANGFYYEATYESGVWKLRQVAIAQS
jgi:hypothetical protein